MAKSSLSGQTRKITLDNIKVQRESFEAFKNGKRIIVNQGGTRSGKTYGLLKILIAIAFSQKVSISITSISFPHLRKGAMRDWKVIMESFGIYSEGNHTKTEHIYTFPNGSYMEFFSTDNHLKVRGPGRDIWFANEANLIDYDTYLQMAMRTKQTIFLDFNPADEFHWIYDNVIAREDCKFIQSNYLDNPFLNQSQKKEIEGLKDIDANLWNVFGLGNRGSSQYLIYPKFKIVESFDSDGCVYGLDFGYNHPAALVRCKIIENEIFFDELLYESYLTTPQLIEKIKPIVNRSQVYCDSARPEIISELSTSGINAIKANKNVKEGIDFVKSHIINLTKNSFNMQKEFRSYKWKLDKMERTTDEPVKAFDDCCDAARYAAISFKNMSVSYIPKYFKKPKHEYHF